MSELLVLKAERRDRAGKGAARAVRRNGVVPAVIYGNKQDPELISLDPKPLEAAIKKRGFYSTIMAVDVAGKATKVLPRDVQLDPVTDRPIHADFQRVDEKSSVRVWVPVKFVNQEQSLQEKEQDLKVAQALPLLGEAVGAHFARSAARWADRTALVVREQRVRWSYARIDAFASSVFLTR